jgi:hypothetical protein
VGGWPGQVGGGTKRERENARGAGFYNYTAKSGHTLCTAQAGVHGEGSSNSART